MNSRRFFSSSYKYRFVQGFVRALKRINRQKKPSNTTTTSMSCPREICSRYLKVRSAADASMASAVGSRRTWSRALLHKIRRQHHCRNSGNYKYSPVRRTSTTSMKKIRYYNFAVLGDQRKERSSDDNNYVTYVKDNNSKISKANKLRKLVPGGEAMDMCNLLEETAHYIMCLDTQVKLMRRIADFASTN